MTLDDLVTAWHEGDSELSLQDYLGLSEEEYSQWVKDGYLLLVGPGEIVDAHNALRAAHGLPPLMFNPTLHRVSLEWAQHLSETGQCNHGSGSTMFDRRIHDAGYDGIVGENAAVGQRTLSEAMTDWMGSPGHRRAILNANFSEMGGSALQLDSGTTAFVVCFGRPKAVEI